MTSLFSVIPLVLAVATATVQASLSPEVNTEHALFSQYFLNPEDADYPLKTYPLFIGNHKE